MADGHGGARTPSNPAPVSGPGAHSQRTDGGPGHVKSYTLPDSKYGEAATFAADQAGGKLNAPPVMPMGAEAFAMPHPGVGMGDPSANPDQPVTAGANAGAGPSAADVGIVQPATSEREDLIRRYGSLMPILVAKVEDPHTSDYTKQQIRQVIAIMTAPAT